MIIEALLVVAGLSLVVSRVILDQLRDLDQLAADLGGDRRSSGPLARFRPSTAPR